MTAKKDLVYLYPLDNLWLWWIGAGFTVDMYIYTKDRIEEIDFQKPFLLSSTGQSQNFTGHLSVEYATSASLLQAN